MEPIDIIDYADKYHSDFRKINLEWLNYYHLAEEADMLVLNNPTTTILDNGGFIYLAALNNNIVGSAALVKEHEGIYELAKMAVSEPFRGRGISRLLIEKCLSKAKELSATKVELFSNHQLSVAIRLYEKYGFKHVALKHSPFVTADVKMELVL